MQNASQVKTVLRPVQAAAYLGISRLVAAGVPMLTVARLTGHKSAKMIEQHYGHLCPASASTALNLLDESRSPSRDFVSEKHPAC